MSWHNLYKAPSGAFLCTTLNSHYYGEKHTAEGGNVMNETVYGIVPMSLEDWEDKKIPHVQPGVDIRFEKFWTTATRSIDTPHGEPYSLEPKTAIKTALITNALELIAVTGANTSLLGI